MRLEDATQEDRTAVRDLMLKAYHIAECEVGPAWTPMVGHLLEAINDLPTLGDGVYRANAVFREMAEEILNKLIDRKNME